MSRSESPRRSFSRDQLHAALGEVVGAARPDYLADIVAHAGRTGQRPGWAVPDWWVPGDIGVRRPGTVRIAVLIATLVLLALLAVGVYVGARPTAPPDLGIFEPVAGRIVSCGNGGDQAGMWAVDPSAPAPVSEMARAVVVCGPAGADELLAWSSDGLSLLLLRDQPDPRYNEPPFDRHLYLVRSDGTEIQVVPGPVRDAAISPDGSRVAFTVRSVPGREPIDEGLFVVDVDGGEPERIAAEGTSPTFSSDGMRLAYLASPPGLTVFGVTGSAPVWVVNVDGTDASEILAGEPASSTVEAKRIKWSPVGDRILMLKAVAGQEGASAVYTFAADGSDLTQVIALGWDPHWSPDGSRIAYTCVSPETCSIAIADANGSNVRRFDIGRSGPWHPGSAAQSPSAP